MTCVRRTRRTPNIVQRARLASRRGEWNEAADLWRDALLVDDRVAAHWLAMGDALSRAERSREAVAAYQRAIQLDARLTRDGTRRVARAYARMGDDRQAVRWLELALRAGVSPDAGVERGRVRRLSERPTAARAGTSAGAGQAVAHRREFGDRELVSG